MSLRLNAKGRMLESLALGDDATDLVIDNQRLLGREHKPQSVIQQVSTISNAANTLLHIIHITHIPNQADLKLGRDQSAQQAPKSTLVKATDKMQQGSSDRQDITNHTHNHEAPQRNMHMQPQPQITMGEALDPLPR